MVEDWVISHRDHPILIIKYENLKRNYTFEVKRILKFLEIPYTDQDVYKKIEKDFNLFHRSHQETFEHYTRDQKWRILDTIRSTIQSLRSSGYHLLDLEEYLDPTRI